MKLSTSKRESSLSRACKSALTTLALAVAFLESLNVARADQPLVIYEGPAEKFAVVIRTPSFIKLAHYDDFAKTRAAGDRLPFHPIVSVVYLRQDEGGGYDLYYSYPNWTEYKVFDAQNDAEAFMKQTAKLHPQWKVEVHVQK